MSLQTQILIQQWATEHWWMAFWLVFWALLFAYGAFAMAYRLGRMTWRSIVVLCRGWPPAHLDADGDWKTEPARPPLASETVTAIGDRSVTERIYREEKKA